VAIGVIHSVTLDVMCPYYRCPSSVSVRSSGNSGNVEWTGGVPFATSGTGTGTDGAMDLLTTGNDVVFEFYWWTHPSLASSSSIFETKR